MKKNYRELSSDEGNRMINTESLFGVPTCPCCGSQFGLVVCSCGNIMCSDGSSTPCPWCGETGELGEISDGGININRGQG